MGDGSVAGGKLGSLHAGPPSSADQHLRLAAAPFTEFLVRLLRPAVLSHRRAARTSPPMIFLGLSAAAVTVERSPSAETTDEQPLCTQPAADTQVFTFQIRQVPGTRPGAGGWPGGAGGGRAPDGGSWWGGPRADSPARPACLCQCCTRGSLPRFPGKQTPGREGQPCSSHHADTDGRRWGSQPGSWAPTEGGSSGGPRLTEAAKPVSVSGDLLALRV